MDLKKIRKDFPILKKKVNGKPLIYLDNAATTQKPKQVINAVKEFYEVFNANVHRGVYSLSSEATERYEDSRKFIAEFIGAEKEEVVFTKGTTDSINSLSRVISGLFEKGKDEIVLIEMEHHANLIPWQQLAKKLNFKLKFIKINENFELDYEDAKKKITNKTALVSFCYVSNSLGTRNDVKNLIRLSKEKNALSFVDAAQAVSHFGLDVKKIDCDFLAFSGHKVYGPTGIGVLYGKKELLEKMEPFEFGGDMIKEVSYESASWNDVPWKFEAGTQNIAGVIGLAEALKYLGKIGMNEIEKYEKEVFVYALENLKKIKDIEIYSSGSENSCGVISFNIKNIHPHDVISLIDDYGICLRGGHHCNMPLMKKLGISGSLRLSLGVYNTKEEIDVLVKALEEIGRKMG